MTIHKEKKKICLRLGLLLLLSVFFFNANAQYTLKVSEQNKPYSFKLVASGKAATIIIDKKDAEVVKLVAADFRDDIHKVTGILPSLITDEKILSTELAVIAGTQGSSELIDDLVRRKKLPDLKGKWETYYITLIKNPAKNIKQALVIAGSDRRGTAFGLFEISRMIGVHPFYWWADITPKHRANIFIEDGKPITSHPSVKYRGIFLNDEDWGLQPWAAKNMDKDLKDIGPRTYEKIFELLLRLKANYIWPAMHPCTKAFWFYRENAVLADKYAIVLGASHCEPMLRNNVFEWAQNYEQEYKTKPGEWRYDVNQKQIVNYWEDRVKEAKNTEAVYTVGMRGIHDGSMPGPKLIPEKVKLLEQIIADQRTMLKKQLQRPPADVPQIFCPYKEVLTIYQAGTKLPDDVTIVWSDDNHGYIRQLSDSSEQKRSGRSGVYYHLSYWGKPQDYLWLSSISPSLISYEMTKAYDYSADRLWVFNVGDLKPAEAEIQFALELAWDVNKWKPQHANGYAKQWAAEIFGDNLADGIAEIKNEYYRLAASGKPEHINSVSFSDEEINKRLADYKLISDKAKELRTKIPARLQDAYFELILYPVEGARLMNEKIFYSKRGNLQKAQNAYDTIQLLTGYYNTQILNGKWNGIISSHPRDQKIFSKPVAGNSFSEQELTKETPSLIINAYQYSNKKEAPGMSVTTVAGLGINAKGITVFPFTFRPYTKENISKAPYVEYHIKAGAGNKKIVVKCLPTFAVNKADNMEFGISINGEKTKIINIGTKADTKPWALNVLRGYAEGSTDFDFTSGVTTIRIYFPQPGLVINTIEIK